MTTQDSYEIVKHNIRVSNLAEGFARYLGFSEEMSKMVAVAGVFIDLGKIAMDYSVFNKERVLTEDEFEYVKQHSSKSTEILIQSNLISKDILSCIIHHHENFDGTGYPSKLKGIMIPEGARVLKICDVYLALIEKRPYRESFSHEGAIEIIRSERNKFDSKLLDEFVVYIESSKQEYK
ncbi:MAG: phosphohydrolase [Firmicutes bacterium HGW-Firmicutes-1]|jgi:HD-GYP domain-containing protein (c-di-GMP phosphodiesterase class II)|nr:MAG: phosphohydrolase [Firmicutes bacterium HGW-Firmicutes-1]